MGEKMENKAKKGVEKSAENVKTDNELLAKLKTKNITKDSTGKEFNKAFKEIATSEKEKKRKPALKKMLGIKSKPRAKKDETPKLLTIEELDGQIKWHKDEIATLEGKRAAVKKADELREQLKKQEALINA